MIGGHQKPQPITVSLTLGCKNSDTPDSLCILIYWHYKSYWSKTAHGQKKKKGKKKREVRTTFCITNYDRI